MMRATRGAVTVAPFRRKRPRPVSSFHPSHGQHPVGPSVLSTVSQNFSIRSFWIMPCPSFVTSHRSTSRSKIDGCHCLRQAGPCEAIHGHAPPRRHEALPWQCPAGDRCPAPSLQRSTVVVAFAMQCSTSPS